MLNIITMTRYTLTNRLFDQVFTNWDSAFFDGDHSYWRRRGNENIKWKEHENSYEYYIPLPGLKKENIKATVKDGVVFIKAGEGENVVSYSFLVPEDADFSKMSASHEDGLLTIALEKSEKAKAIELKID